MKIYRTISIFKCFLTKPNIYCINLKKKLERPLLKITSDTTKSFTWMASGGKGACWVAYPRGVLANTCSGLFDHVKWVAYLRSARGDVNLTRCRDGANLISRKKGVTAMGKTFFLFPCYMIGINRGRPILPCTQFYFIFKFCYERLAYWLSLSFPKVFLKSTMYSTNLSV